MITTHDNPFVEYALFEDKKQYALASTANYKDKDGDFLIGNSGGLLMNFRFKFVDTHLFTNVAETFTNNKKDPDVVKWVENLDLLDGENREKFYYCPYPSDSVEYLDFWRTEKRKRREGVIAPCGIDENGNRINIRITGNHYNYLNYGIINRYPSKEEIEEQKRLGYVSIKGKDGFPRFWDADYWRYKVKELAEINRKNEVAAKARRKGYSYKEAADAANFANLVPFITILFAAHNLDFLLDPSATTDMVKKCLDWYENNTHWQRGYLSEDLAALELGYKLSDQGHKEFGYRSKILSVSTAKNTSAAVGKKADILKFEEAGVYPELAEVIDLLMSNMESGLIKVGNFSIFGTGGTKNANWEAFRNIFYNPRMYDCLEFENVWDKGCRNQTCGFFHPNVWALEDEEGSTLDEHGNSNLLEAYNKDLQLKEIARAKLTDMGKYVTYIGQRANSPGEAFNSGTENIFTSPELDLHIISIRNNPDYKYYRDGMLVEDHDGLVYKTNAQLRDLGIKTHPYLETNIFRQGSDIEGCIREYYPPIKVDGKVPDNLYYVVLDPVAIDKKSDEVTAKHSLNAIYVLMYPNNHPLVKSTGDIIVAGYCGRYEQTSDTSKLVFKLCEYYNAKCLAEVDRGTIVADAKLERKLHLLHTNPMVALTDKISGRFNKDYGIIIGQSERAEEGLIYLRDWVYTPVAKDANGNTKRILHYITDIPFLLELQGFRKNGNFDRISAMRVAMFQRKAYTILRKKAATSKERNIFDEIGLYSNLYRS